LSTSPLKQAVKSDTRLVCSNAPAHVCAFKYVRTYCMHTVRVRCPERRRTTTTRGET
jgi:hypothetical protein